MTHVPGRRETITHGVSVTALGPVLPTFLSYGKIFVMRGRLFLVSGTVGDAQDDTIPVGLELTSDATVWTERPDMARKAGKLGGTVYNNDEDTWIQCKFG